MIKIGRYEVISELGRGAMGIVYKAQDPTIGRLVAIKVLSLDAPTEVGVPDARDIFMREARAAGRLSHPGIVTIHDALEDPESRSCYIVMEFIPGRTLESILIENPSLGTEKAFNIIRQIAEALEYAHQNQIIHRDLKPANILVTGDGRIKITDFGIAKIVARESASRTVAIMGTPSYMSPEQITGGEMDARADLFAMGILFYLMLTGQKPFEGDTVAVMFKIVHEDPVLPSQLNSQVAPGLDYVILRSLAKDRAKRYSSAREFLDDLEDIRQRRPPRSQVKVPSADLHAGEKTIVATKPLIGAVVAQPTPPAPQARRRPLAMVGGAGALVIAAALGFWVLRHRGTPPPSPSATAPATLPATAPAPAPSQQEAMPTASKAAHSSRGTSKPARQGTAKVMKPLPPSSPRQPAPGSTTGSAQPIIESAKPATEAARSSPAASVVAATTSPRVVYLIWQHDMKEAVLTIRSKGATVYQGNLKGKKKGGFLGIKGTYEAMVKRPITIPAGAQELDLHVSSKEGGLELDGKITGAAPPGPSATLRVEEKAGHLTAGWQVTQGAQP